MEVFGSAINARGDDGPKYFATTWLRRHKPGENTSITATHTGASVVIPEFMGLH